MTFFDAGPLSSFLALKTSENKGSNNSLFPLSRSKVLTTTLLQPICHFYHL